MFSFLRSVYQKHREIISYIFFGGCTTLINIISYDLLYYVAGLGNVPSDSLAWLFAVIFAFIVNKLFVFRSKTGGFAAFASELLGFFGCRIATGICDVLFMYLTVDVFGFNPFIMKILDQVMTLVLNFLASKFIIFKRKHSSGEDDTDDEN